MTDAGAAYGVRIETTEFVPPGALDVTGGQLWPRLRVLCEADVPLRSGSDGLAHHREEGTIWVDPEAAVAVLPDCARAEPDMLVHPLLSTAAWLAARARGDAVLHAGAFLAGDGAWVLVGERGAGKSTLLAGLAREGVTVLSDDVTVLRGGRVFAGPRCIDLRADMAAALGVELPSRRGERRRMRLAPCSAEHDLAGFVLLRAGRGVTAMRLDPRERLHAVANTLTQRPLELLEFASVPVVELIRPPASPDYTDAAAAVLASELRL